MPSCRSVASFYLGRSLVPAIRPPSRWIGLAPRARDLLITMSRESDPHRVPRYAGEREAIRTSSLFSLGAAYQWRPYAIVAASYPTLLGPCEVSSQSRDESWLMQATQQPYTKTRKIGVPSQERWCCVALRRVALVPCFALRFCPQTPLVGGSSRRRGVFLARNLLGSTAPTRRGPGMG